MYKNLTTLVFRMPISERNSPLPSTLKKGEKLKSVSDSQHGQTYQSHEDTSHASNKFSTDLCPGCMNIVFTVTVKSNLGSFFIK